MKPKPLIAANITVDKHLPLLPDIRPPAVQEPIIEKTRNDKEWTESKIDLKDLHQYYLKLSKSRLTSNNAYCTVLCYKLNYFSLYKVWWL